MLFTPAQQADKSRRKSCIPYLVPMLYLMRVSLDPESAHPSTKPSPQSAEGLIK